MNNLNKLSSHKINKQQYIRKLIGELDVSND